MVVREVFENEKDQYNSLVDHPLQSWAWGDARRATGNMVLRMAIFNHQTMIKAWLMTVHQVPKLSRTIMYYPRGPLPDQLITQAIEEQARDKGSIFVKIEPDFSLPITEETPVDKHIFDDTTKQLSELGYVAGRPLFTPYNFILNLSPSEGDLLKNFKPKTRYNINLAQKKGVIVKEDNSDQAFTRYLELLAETTSRQKFFAHDADYHRTVWKYMYEAGIAHLFTAVYQQEILSAWILFRWKNKLYYPYGASSRKYKEVMANNLLMWEAIKYGKQQGCTQFDLWGTAGLNPQPTDSWFGFHKFKSGYNPQMVQYIGAYDYVVDPLWYKVAINLDTARRWLLKAKAILLPDNFK